MPATTCDFTQISKAAKAYFTSAQDPVFTLIGNMKQASGAARNPIGWDIMRAVAAERLSSSTTTGSAGAVFVIDIFRCTTYTFAPTASPDVDTGFVNNLATILDQGLFGVRGVGSDPTRPAVALVAGRSAAPPGWGVQPDSIPNVARKWPTDRGTFLIYGYPTVITGLPVDAATSINGTFNAFELGAVPFGISKDGMLVGICSPSVGGGNAIANRLTHNLNEIIVNANPAALCTYASSGPPLLGTQSWPKDALRRFASLFTPATAYAMAGGDEIGGTPSSWSPFSTAALVGTNIGLTITAIPDTGRVGGNIHAVVTAKINNVPVPGVDVTLSVDNNHGVPAGAVIQGGDPTVTTKKDGTATFDFALGKPGAFLIAVKGSLTGVVTASTLSNQINIKQP